MKPWCALLPLIVAAAPAGAQTLPYHDMLAAEDEDRSRLAYAELPGIDPADDGREESVRAFYGDRFEWRVQPGADAYHWDVSAELGGPEHRLWLAVTGDGLFGESPYYVETTALYTRAIGNSGFDLQLGVRRDFQPRPRRSYAAIGVQGNIVDPLYVSAFGFLSHRGEFTGRGVAIYDIPVAERLILQAYAEGEIAGADVPELGIGAGPVYVQGALRLRYRIAEPFAPYVGVNWDRLLGRTARMAREAGDEVSTTQLVVGVRTYF